MGQLPSYEYFFLPLNSPHALIKDAQLKTLSWKTQKKIVQIKYLLSNFLKYGRLKNIRYVRQMRRKSLIEETRKYSLLDKKLLVLKESLNIFI